MSVPVNPADPPMAEPGQRPSNGDVGGVAAAPQAGVADWAQRSSERGEEPAVGPASTGDAAGGATDPRIDRGGKAAPGSAPGASARSDRPRSDDRATAASGAQRRAGSDAGSATASTGQDDDWRHEPVAPVDEPNPLKSLGKAIGDTVTGSDQDTTVKPKR